MTLTAAPDLRSPRTQPRVRAAPRWVLPPPADAHCISTLRDALHSPDALCRLLYARGYADVEAAKRFLRPRFDQLHEPSRMRDLDVAVERLALAIARGETILVHGDYDVDGMATTALLVRVLRGLGAQVVPFIPRRIEDGYDLSLAGVRAALACGARVVLTADCGTNACTAVAELTAAGVDVIISYDHLPGAVLPTCVAVLNPKREGCEYPDKDLAAAGVGFKLALALSRRLGAPDAPVLALLDLVALATVADVAPLRGENRVFVRYGPPTPRGVAQHWPAGHGARGGTRGQADHGRAGRLHPRAAAQRGRTARPRDPRGRAVDD